MDTATQHAQNILLINFALGVILPNVTALVTARLAGSSLKGFVLLVLSAISGVLTQILTQDGDFHWRPALISIGWTFVFSVGAHYGLLKPIGATGTNGAIQTKFSGGVSGSLLVPGSSPVAPDTGGNAPS